MPDLVVAGAGLAGLVAAAEATDRGARVVVHEKGGRAGGSMLLSSGVIWRHRELDDFLRECPGGNRELQRLVHEHLDDDLAWLERKGARVVERSTGNPRTTGIRFDTRSLTEALAREVGEIRLGDALRELPERGRVVLATGGFQANRDLVREWITPEADALFLRATRGARATASPSAERREPRRRAGWTSSTGGTCLRLPRGSRRRSSCPSRSSTGITR